MSPNPETPQSRKRESRAGTRRVTSLSAEQLERKRANDREAQRTIRQRTKEHIERLELQVAELKTKGDKFDEVVRRNASLENEIRALRQQLVLVSSGAGFQNMDETYNPHPGVIVPSPQHPDILGANPSSRAPSVLSTTSQVSVARDWQPYSSTRSSSRCESSDTEYSTPVEPWVFDGPSQIPVSMPVAQSHMGFAQTSGHLADPSFQATYPQMYHHGIANRSHGGRVEQISHNRQPPIPYNPSQGTVSVPPERQPAGYPHVHPAQQYQPSGEQPPRNSFGYDWVQRP